MFRRTAFRDALALAATLLLSATAHAQLFRSYLAPTGSDANPCTLPAPCRLLPAALAAVADGGEIWMLDSANYNTATVNITKSVTILAVPGAVGSILAIGGPAITVTSISPKLTLRNIVIVPLPGGGGTDGITMTGGFALTLENCLIANMPGNGIVVSTPATVRIVESTIRDNVGIGLQVDTGARAVISRSTFAGNIAIGIIAWGTGANTTTADITDSLITGSSANVLALSTHAAGIVNVSVSGSRLLRSTTYGAHAESDAAASVSLSVTDSTVTNAVNGIAASNSGTRVYVSGTSVSGSNANAFLNSGGLFESAGNNSLRHNATDTTGTITAAATK